MFLRVMPLLCNCSVSLCLGTWLYGFGQNGDRNMIYVVLKKKNLDISGAIFSFHHDKNLHALRSLLEKGQLLKSQAVTILTAKIECNSSLNPDVWPDLPKFLTRKLRSIINVYYYYSVFKVLCNISFIINYTISEGK